MTQKCRNVNLLSPCITLTNTRYFSPNRQWLHNHFDPNIFHHFWARVKLYSHKNVKTIFSTFFNKQQCSIVTWFVHRRLFSDLNAGEFRIDTTLRFRFRAPVFAFIDLKSQQSVTLAFRLRVWMRPEVGDHSERIWKMVLRSAGITTIQKYHPSWSISIFKACDE